MESNTFLNQKLLKKIFDAFKDEIHKDGETKYIYFNYKATEN